MPLTRIEQAWARATNHDCSRVVFTSAANGRPDAGPMLRIGPSGPVVADENAVGEHERLNLDFGEAEFLKDLRGVLAEEGRR